MTGVQTCALPIYVLTATATVTAKHDEGNLVDLDLVVENQAGAQAVVGSATVAAG